MRVKDLSVRNKLALPIVAVVTIVIMVTIFVTIGKSREIVIDDARTGTLQGYRDTVLNALTTAMIQGNIKEYKTPFLEQMRSIADVKVIRADAVDKDYGKGSPEDYATDEIEREVLQTGVEKTALEGDHFRGVYPYIGRASFMGKNCLSCHNVKEGTVLGAVSIRIPLTAAFSNIRSARNFYFGLGLVGIVIVTGLIILIVNATLKPLLYLTGIVRQLAEGDLRIKVSYEARDEIGLLSESMRKMIASFNFFVEEIAKSREQIKKQSEELLREKDERLQAIGVLAGGIAHDFNNLLQGIMGSIGIAKLYAKEDKLKEILDRAENASVSATELSFRLLTFSKGGEPVIRIINISKLIEETTNLALCDSSCITREFVFPDNLYPVKGDEGQLYQVIRNISINAKEAMPDGGKVTFIGENVTVTEDSKLALKTGNYIKISIKDEGVGIPEESLTKIFDPYFTTKDIGSDKGTGLGLSICHSIIKKHGGLITVESQTGVGSTFHIYLPASKK